MELSKFNKSYIFKCENMYIRIQTIKTGQNKNMF